jgi:outer membrane protein insertion porin family
VTPTDDHKGAAAIRALFALGLFKDVRLEVNNDVLVVIVEERPTVADVDFSGNKEFDKDVLKKALRDIGLTDGRPFDQALADRAEQELKRQYINRSLYGAEVVTTVTPIERNRVNLTFTSPRASRAHQGNPHRGQQGVFSESTLQGPVRPRHRRLAELVHQVRPVFARQAQCRSGDAALVLPDARLPGVPHRFHPGGHLAGQAGHHHHRQRHEGERYVVSSVKLEGNYLDKDDEFKSLVTIKPGEPYNADQVAETTKAFTDYFGNFGFAFAQVEARPK